VVGLELGRIGTLGESCGCAEGDLNMVLDFGPGRYFLAGTGVPVGRSESEELFVVWDIFKIFSIRHPSWELKSTFGATGDPLVSASPSPKN